jgi:hypothetical protein
MRSDPSTEGCSRFHLLILGLSCWSVTFFFLVPLWYLPLRFSLASVLRRSSTGFGLASVSTYTTMRQRSMGFVIGSGIGILRH